MPGETGTTIARRTQPARQTSDPSQSRTATRALDVLEYFGAVRRPARAIEISRALDLHPSTANQLLKTLVGSAHLVFDARAKTYLPSPRLTGFGGWMVESYGQDRFHRLLEEVRRITRAPVVTLSTPNDLSMQVLDLAADTGWRGCPERGRNVSLFGAFAIGKAYLSAIPLREVERLSMRARLPEPRFVEFRQSVLDARDAGFAEGGEPNGEVRSFAIPLPRCAPVPLVLGIADSADRMIRNSVVLYAQMREAVDRWN